MDGEKIRVGEIDITPGIVYDVEKKVLKRNGSIAMSLNKSPVMGLVFTRLVAGGLGNLVSHQYLAVGINDGRDRKDELRHYIKRLNKLLQVNDVPLLIQSVFGEGYRLTRVLDEGDR